MNIARLERWQVEKLFKDAQRELHYLDRLEGHMHQKHFPASDSVYEQVKKARAGIKELMVQQPPVRLDYS